MCFLFIITSRHVFGSISPKFIMGNKHKDDKQWGFGGEAPSRRRQ